MALAVGAVVCIAAAIAGATSQDLKTGFLVGATPVYQQIGLVIGVLASSFIIGITTLYLHSVFVIGSESLAAPQATLMSTIIKGLLSQNLPWGLVLVGVFISITLELCGIKSLSFAVGLLSAHRHHRANLRRRRCPLVCRTQDRHQAKNQKSARARSFSSGLIAGGSLAGILYAVLFGLEIVPAADDATTLGLMPMLHEGTPGLVAGGPALLRACNCWHV